MFIRPLAFGTPVVSCFVVRQTERKISSCLRPRFRASRLPRTSDFALFEERSIPKIPGSLHNGRLESLLSRCNKARCLRAAVRGCLHSNFITFGSGARLHRASYAGNSRYRFESVISVSMCRSTARTVADINTISPLYCSRKDKKRKQRMRQRKREGRKEKERERNGGRIEGADFFLCPMSMAHCLIARENIDRNSGARMTSPNVADSTCPTGNKASPVSLIIFQRQ